MTIPQSPLVRWLLVIAASCPRPMLGDDSTALRQKGAKATSDEEMSKHTMRIKVIGPDGKPLEEAQVHRSVWTKEKNFKANKDVVTDADGQAVVDLPQSFYILRLWARKAGHAPLFAHWEQEELAVGEHVVPEEFTFRLQKGTMIGGFVYNENGKPIEGAKVEVKREPDAFERAKRTSFCTWLAEGNAARTTDARGFWRLDNVPAGDDAIVRVKLSHLDYVDDREWGGLQREQKVSMKSLRDLSAKIVMRRGISVHGHVTDPKGNAVDKAVVVWGDNPYNETGSQEVRTNERGQYRLPQLAAGKLNVTVIAEGWSPMLKTIDVSAESPPIDFKLKTGRTVRIRFVDGGGNPVPDVFVGIARWRGGRSLYNNRHPNVLDTKIPRKAGADGIYEWTWAPGDEVTYSFYKEGYRILRHRAFSPGDGEQEVHLE